MLDKVHRAGLAERPFMSVGRAVHRLTREIADWLNLDAGRIEVGSRADIVVIDPEHFGDVEDIHEAEMACLGGLSRLVRRNDEAVRAVLVAGTLSAERGQPVDVGSGRVLRASSLTVGARKPRDLVGPL